MLDINFDENEFISAEKMIQHVLSKYIQNNYCECSSYFASITVYKLEEYFSDKKIYDDIKKEAKILINNNCINKKRRIDLISFKEKILYDLCESKHTLASQREIIVSEINEMCIVRDMLISYDFKSNCFFGTLDFMKKDKIKINFDNILKIENIITGEDLFSCKIS